MALGSLVARLDPTNVAAITAAAVDPASASIVVAICGSFTAVVVAVITARSSAERLADKDRIRRLEKHIVKLGGDPDDA